MLAGGSVYSELAAYRRRQSALFVLENLVCKPIVKFVYAPGSGGCVGPKAREVV